jgi:hypothetical protein
LFLVKEFFSQRVIASEAQATGGFSYPLKQEGYPLIAGYCEN